MHCNSPAKLKRDRTAVLWPARKVDERFSRTRRRSAASERHGYRPPKDPFAVDTCTKTWERNAAQKLRRDHGLRSACFRGLATDDRRSPDAVVVYGAPLTERPRGPAQTTPDPPQNDQGHRRRRTGCEPGRTDSHYESVDESELPHQGERPEVSVKKIYRSLAKPGQTIHQGEAPVSTPSTDQVREGPSWSTASASRGRGSVTGLPPTSLGSLRSVTLTRSKETPPRRTGAFFWHLQLFGHGDRERTTSCESVAWKPTREAGADETVRGTGPDAGGKRPRPTTAARSSRRRGGQKPFR